MVNGFLDIIGMQMDMWYRCSNIILDACIRNNDNRIGIHYGVLEDFVKFTEMSFSAFFIFVVCSMKWKKKLGKLSISLKPEEFMIKRIKRRKNSIISIYYGTLDFLLLLGCHIFQR